MRFNSIEEKRRFLAIALNKGMYEARKCLPKRVVRYIHKGGKVYDDEGNETKVKPSKYPNTIIIHRKIIDL